MMITVMEGSTTVRVDGLTFDADAVKVYPKGSLERSVAWRGFIEEDRNRTECAALRRHAATIPVREIRRNQSYANAPWGAHRMEKVLTDAGETSDDRGIRREGEALSMAVWERLVTHDRQRQQAERDRIDRTYGLTDHMVRLTRNGTTPDMDLISRYMPPPVRRWDVIDRNGNLDPATLILPLRARRKRTWEITGDAARLDAADLDLLMAVCAGSGHAGIFLIATTDGGLKGRWSSKIGRRAGMLVDDDRLHVPQPPTPELVALFDAAETRIAELGIDVSDRRGGSIPRYQYQGWPLSGIMFERKASDEAEAV